MDQKNKIIKFAILVLITNILTYLIAIEDPTSYQKTQPIQQEFLIRKDYVKLVVAADLLTEYEDNKAISLHNHHNKKVVDIAFLLKEMTVEAQDSPLGSHSKKYLIYVHQNNINKLLTERALKVLPFEAKGITTHHKGNRHEIII